ncbi:hypothetical protein JW968_04285 [Candidatus Woesearchaeota archaeon]|nr:hypothetical protein [Candidatus Woesearchaeota archaeon]
MEIREVSFEEAIKLDREIPKFSGENKLADNINLMKENKSLCIMVFENGKPCG